MPKNRLLAITFAFALTALSACGADTDTEAAVEEATTTEAATAPTTAAPTTTVEEDDDHDDDDDDHDDASGLGAHEHGTAEMTVAWIDGDVAIDVISPLFNIFGFEYEPETDEDIALAEERTSQLTADGTLTISDEAGRTLTEPVATEIERDGSHSEIVASWSFTCENPDEITTVDATELFASFPNFEDIDAQWISATDQSSAELSPDSPTLALES